MRRYEIEYYRHEQVRKQISNINKEQSDKFLQSSDNKVGLIVTGKWEGKEESYGYNMNENRERKSSQC